jgi:predicted dehydrogenase
MDSRKSLPRNAGRGRFSRRSLLAGAAAAASLAVVRPSAVRGAEANSKVELGVVGCGGRGRWIANLFAQHGGYKVTAVADYSPPAADRAAETLGVDQARRFSGLLGYWRLIESKVDAVALETPPWFFPEHAAAAVGAGCHVYMAKPVACDVPGCLAVAALGRKATQTQRCFLVDLQTRTEPLFQEAIRRVHEGALGPLGLIVSCYQDDGFADPPKTRTLESRLHGLIWCNDDDLGGGYIVNCDVHAIDVALWIAGQTPASALGSSRIRRKDPHGDSADVYSVTYEFPGGFLLNHRSEHVNNQAGCITCSAYGQGAFIETNYGGKTWLRGGPMAYKGGDVQNLYTEGAKRNIDTFHKSITQGLFDNPTVQPSVNSTLACILGREAARNNTRLTWDELLKANQRIDLDLTGLVQ